MKIDDIELVRSNLAKYLMNKNLGSRRIRIEKEELETLLFDTCTYKIDEEKSVTLKYPIWTGEFLKKVDLSEISFKDDEIEGVFYIFDPIVYADISHRKLEDLRGFYPSNQNYFIDFSNTNANFNFEDMFLFKKIYPGLNLRYCNFYNMNLRESNISSLFQKVSIHNCNFGCTKIDLDMNDFYSNLVFKCKFNSVKTKNSDIHVNLFEDFEKIRFFTNDFSGTGITICYTPKGTFKDEMLNAINDAKKNGRLNGCTINNKKVKVDKDSKNISMKTRRYIKRLKNNIDKQINHNI